MHDRRWRKIQVFKVETGLIAAKRNAPPVKCDPVSKFGGIIAESNKFENTIFIPPVSIAEGRDIKNLVNQHMLPWAKYSSSIILYSKRFYHRIFSKLYDVVLDDLHH